MSDQNKLAVLSAILVDATIGNPVRLSFNTLEKKVAISKEELETILTALNKERFISQYAKKGVDSFTFTANQKGIDAVQDESFI